MMRGAWAALALVAACGGRDTGSGAVPGTGPGDPQTPPTGAAAVDVWLANGYYKSWHCEPAPHDARPPSPHGLNRICSNELLSKHGTGEFPVGSAAVKELYSVNGEVAGHAVYLKVSAGGGGSFYWFERLPGGSLSADGLGTSGAPHDSCVSCHDGAGTGGRSGHDDVYTQVK